jgi:UDP-N-acetylmuramate dehydrogenase
MMMVPVKENVDLFPCNTFGIHATARYFVTITSLEEALEVFQSDLFHEQPVLILGGGSNVLLTKDFDGLVIRNAVEGISVVWEDDTTLQLKVGSGESWHGLVMHCVRQNLGGIENLSLIPGTVGAAPMQNIGAYGVEIREVISSVEAVDMKTGAIRTFSREGCAFGYRESIFKQHLKGRYFISSVTLTLTKKDHRFNVSYGAILEVLKEKNVKDLSIRAISEAVIDIRSKKLPDPSKIGNAGSFFKNPSVDAAFFESLKNDFHAMPSFPGENNLVKIPAAWLIEQCGWKGKTLGNIGVHKHQALVLVNYGNGEGRKIWELAIDIQSSVKEKFNILLQPEVNVIG